VGTAARLAQGPRRGALIAAARAGRRCELLVVALALAAGAGATSTACTRTSRTAGSHGAQPVAVAHSYEPTGLGPGERRPLVVLLHGLGGSADELLEDADLGSFGQRHGVFVIAPEGTIDSRGRRFWDAGGACCNFDRASVDDVGRLAAIIDTWSHRAGVDARRIYVMGFSNGGFLAHRLACRIGDRLAAVASVGGAGPDEGELCPLASPIGVLEVHGDGDRIVRYGGGRVFDSVEMAPFPSAEVTVRAWARRLGCPAAPGPPEELDVDDRLPGDETAVLAYRGCKLGGAELWTVRGGRHAVGTARLYEEMWRFLSGHAKPAT
jgi:polyhydroxybutyrate depolymerase